MNRAKESRKTHSRRIGLELGSLCGNYFLKLNSLHYGYWPGDLPVDISNLHIAQDNYSNFLISHIPDGVRSVLDVCCGTGSMARLLTDKGYQVDGVSPSPYLAEKTRKELGNSGEVFECYYEDLRTDNNYDLILFSESFQYLLVDKASISFEL